MPPTPFLHSVFNISPITSLAFLGHSHLLTGEASCVNVFSANPPFELLHKKQIFKRERIHGIVPSNSTTPDGGRILFWGGRSIAVVPVASILSDDAILEVEEIGAPDWVLSAAFLPCNKAIAIGAHNELQIYTDGICEQVSCGITERTMLYAADLLVTDLERATVAAGTVFGEIVIWNWTMGDKGGNVVKRLRGHEGSVFAVRFHSGGRWIGSCSDDRTVRVWDLHSTVEGNDSKETTGFGEVEGRGDGGEGCVALGWGHQARPWGVRFLPDQGEEVRLASVSEDLTARFWAFTSSNLKGRAAMLENTQTWMLHQGKNIWSFALDYERQLIATGGADGRVVVLDYSDDAEQRDEWALEDVLTELKDGKADETTVYSNLGPPAKKNKEKRDAFKNYAALDKDRFVVTTGFGQVLLCTMLDTSWRSLGKWEGLRNWSVVEAWEGTGIVALGDLEGRLGILDVDNHREWWWDAGGKGKVAEVFSGGTDGGAFSLGSFLPVHLPLLLLLLLLAVHILNPLIIDFFRVVTTSVGPAAPILHTFRLQVDKPPMRSCIILQTPVPRFNITSVLVSTEARQIFLGSRAGDLSVYSLPCPDSSSTELGPVSYHPALYSSDALTSLALSPRSPTTLLTTSFSGIHTAHALPSLDAIHISKPGNVSNITGQFFSGKNNEELNIYGFRGSRFVVHNTVTSSDTFAVDCRGGHRAWTFTPSESTPWFIWTQGSNANSSRSKRTQLAVLKHGSHGREIKTSSFCMSTRLLATGAEDTTIRISHVSGEGIVEERGAVTTKRHTTGVMHLEWSKDGKRLFSSGGVDELFIFRVRLGDDGTVGVVEESVLPVPKSEAEVRICGLDVVERGGEYWVAGAMSDGCVKIWSYQPKGNIWLVVGEATYGTCCILHAKFLEVDSRLALLIAATDGHLAVYDPISPLGMKQVWRERVHQSSIKALSSAVLPGGRVEIYTGGDDCAIAITKLESPGWVTEECSLLPRAHASAVTAVLPAAGGRLVTAGLDQRVKVWDRGFARLGMASSAVADCSGAVLTPGGIVVIVGVGIEGWKMG